VGEIFEHQFPAYLSGQGLRDMTEQFQKLFKTVLQ